MGGRAHYFWGMAAVTAQPRADRDGQELPPNADGLDDETFERVSEEQRGQPAVEDDDGDRVPSDPEIGKD